MDGNKEIQTPPAPSRLISRRRFLTGAAQLLGGLVVSGLSVPPDTQAASAPTHLPEITATPTTGSPETLSLDPIFTLLVDRAHPISEEAINRLIVPQLIVVEANDPEISISNHSRLLIHQICRPDLARLMAASRQAGAALKVGSAFRSYADQQRALNAVGGDTTLVAPVGTSQHHTGLALDFTIPENGNVIDHQASPLFENTSAGRWVIDNGPQYDFIRTYIPVAAHNGQCHDNVRPESWHFYYAGPILGTAYRSLLAQGWNSDFFEFQEGIRQGDPAILAQIQNS